MASFDINFIANTTGVHTVYWRNYEDPVNTYPNSDSVNVTAPGLQTITIEVTGNLYCAYDGIQYNGYVIADCQAPTPTTNGIPDSVLAAGTTWQVLMAQQTDPCQLTTIACDNVPIANGGITITDGGSYYGGQAGNAGAAMTVVFSAPTAPGGTTATAVANQGDGVLTGISIALGGSGYPEADGTQVGIPLIEVGQVATHGAGATVDVTFTSGVITAVTLNAAGSAYTTSDSGAPLTVDYTALTVGTAPTTEVQFNISASGYFADQVDIGSFSVVSYGSGYQSAPTISFGVTEGSEATYTITMEDCPSLLLSDYDCGSVVNVVGTPDYVLPLTDSLQMCADATLLAGISSQFSTTDDADCHCITCKNIEIDMSGTTSGTGSVTYQTCWDGTNAGYDAIVMVTNALTGGSANVDLGCVMDDTVYIDQGTLDALPTTIITSCP